nr:MAG TPA: hypothetical protein [Caudoviricetes sp.]
MLKPNSNTICSSRCKPDTKKPPVGGQDCFSYGLNIVLTFIFCNRFCTDYRSFSEIS